MTLKNKVMINRKKQEKKLFEKIIILTFFVVSIVGIFGMFSSNEEVSKNVPSKPTTVIVAEKKPDSQTLVKQDIIAYNKSLNEDEANILAEKITSTANNVGVSPELLACLFKQESNYNQGLENAVGATGIGQLTPICQDHLNNRGHNVNRYDLDSNILGSAIYLKEMLTMFNGNERLALAAYNAGPGAVSYYGDVPPYGETQHYVKNIMLHKEEAFS